MLSARLFIGIPVNFALEEALLQVERSLLNSYLEEVEHESCRILGKYLEAPCELEAIEQSEMHIRSVLQRLLSKISLDQQELVLIPVKTD